MHTAADVLFAVVAIVALIIYVRRYRHVGRDDGAEATNAFLSGVGLIFGLAVLFVALSGVAALLD